MPDICMCKIDECSKKETCYRYSAKPNEPYQAYADYKFICHDRKYYLYWHMKQNLDTTNTNQV